MYRVFLVLLLCLLLAGCAVVVGHVLDRAGARSSGGPGGADLPWHLPSTLDTAPRSVSGPPQASPPPLSPTPVGGSTVPVPQEPSAVPQCTAAADIAIQGSEGDPPLSFNDLCVVAEGLYDAVAEDAGVADTLAEIFEALGVPVLEAERDEAEVRARLAAGEPIVLDVQLQAMAGGFRNGSLVDLDSFFAAYSELGVSAENPPGPFTRAHLSGRLAHLVGKPEILPGELLPALVFALGHERASRLGGGSSDPVWGDPYLDPLQFALLSYAIQQMPRRRSTGAIEPEFETWRFNTAGTIGPDNDSGAVIGRSRDTLLQLAALSASPADETAPLYATAPDREPRIVLAQLGGGGKLGKVLAKITAKGVGKAGLFMILEESFEKIGRIVEYPLGVGDSLDAMICASILLYSYKLAIVPPGPDPAEIWRRQPERPTLPYKAKLTAQLVFDFVPSEAAPAGLVLKWAGCRKDQLPKPGPIAGHPIWWRMGDELVAHGNLLPGERPTASGRPTTLEVPTVDEKLVPYVGTGEPDRAAVGGGADRTDQSGLSHAVFTAIDEKVPPERRDPERKRTTTGQVSVRANNLLPGLARLELVVRGIRGDLAFAKTTLTVNWFVEAGDYKADWVSFDKSSGWRRTFHTLKCDGPAEDWVFQMNLQGPGITL
jgi:hypothetical protein